MKKKDMRIEFDLDNEIDNRVYYALKNLPGYFDEPDFSRAVILFINSLVASMGECEERREECERLLEALAGEGEQGRQTWQ